MGTPRVQYGSLRLILSAIALVALAGVTRANPPAQNRPKPEAPPVRVALLNFGPPAQQLNNGACCDSIGDCIDPKDWLDAITLLEKDKAEVVVFVVHSGGGDTDTVQAFQDLIEKEYKSRFRTVAWIDWCVFKPALALLPVEEFYFKPAGVFGSGEKRTLSATYWPSQSGGCRQLIERGSRLGKRDPAVARAFVDSSALSADIDPPSGTVVWRPDELGQVLVNKEGSELAFNADLALQTRLSRGTAENREELAVALGIANVEWVGQQAAEHINTVQEKRLQTRELVLEAHLRAMGQLGLAERAATPKEVRQHADAALQYIRQLDALAAEHADVFERAVPRNELERLRSKAKHLRNWPTLRATLNEASQRKPE